MKTSAVAVRSVLRDGLEHPSGYQTARAGLATFTAVKLYRDGLDGRYKRLTPLPPSLASREGGAPSRRAKPLRGCLRVACSAAVGLFFVSSAAGGFQRGWVVI